MFSVGATPPDIHHSVHRFLSPPQHHQHILIISILTGVRQDLIVVLIFISLMANDTEHFFHVFN